MNKLALLATVAAMVASAPALAQRGPIGDPYGDATVSKAEAEKQAGERFAAIDGNSDGTLSGDEQDAAMETPGGRGLRRADLNADGKITRAEFMESQMGRFDSQDADKDGQLTKAERDAARERMRASRGWGAGGPGGPGGDQ